MTVKITLPHDNSYDIFIDELNELYFDRKVVIITNPTVSGFHLEYLKSKLNALNLSVCTIPDGEEYKHMQTIEDMLAHCFTHRLDRKSLLSFWWWCYWRYDWICSFNISKRYRFCSNSYNFTFSS